MRPKKLAALLLLVPTATYVYALQSGIAVPARPSIPQYSSFVAANANQSPQVTPGADGSYSVALADGSTVTFLNKGTRVEVANPAVTIRYPQGVKMIALQYVSARTTVARSILSLGGGRDGAAASPAGNWESADVDPRTGGFSGEWGLFHSRLQPAYVHTVSGEVLDAMKVAKAANYKIVGEAAMKNLYGSPYVGGRSGGRVFDR